MPVEEGRHGGGRFGAVDGAGVQGESAQGLGGAVGSGAGGIAGCKGRGDLAFEGVRPADTFVDVL
ncbi:hypothetical protein ACH420_46850 [Streptomyces griseoruber]|uniref:hypothetical protein n=1 Tax=Streptomyces griseoruber TaxID=1943 RepID=UPI0037A4A081